MGKILVQIKTPFGEIVVEGDSAQEILATLKTMPIREVDSANKDTAGRNRGTHNRGTNCYHPREAHPLRSYRTDPVCFRRKNQHRYPDWPTAGFKRD